MLIVEDIGSANNSAPAIAWGTLVANANDIIEWDGSKWSVLFDSTTSLTLTYITNTFTGIQYKWSSVDGIWQWSKSYEGIYDPGAWRIVL